LAALVNLAGRVRRNDRSDWSQGIIACALDEIVNDGDTKTGDSDDRQESPGAANQVIVGLRFLKNFIIAARDEHAALLV
jgi:hypothetical protein